MAGVDLSRLTLEELEALSQQSGSVIAGTPAVSEFFSSKPFTYQREWYDSKKPYQFIFAGNRTGKSKTLIDRLLIELTGVKPAALGGHAPPRWPEGNRKHILCLLASETDETLERNLLPKLRKLVTPEMLEKGVNVNSVKRPWRFRSGAQFYFATYKQSTAALEGSAWHFIGLDEPPPQKWFNAVTRGAIDHQAQVMLAATPLKEPWLLDDMILPSQDSGHTLYGKVDSWNVPMHRNCRDCHPGDGALAHEAIMTYLATLPPSERAAREFGQFASLIGLEFNYIEDKDHIVPDFQVPVTWPLVEVVDPAMKRGIYVMWFVVDPDEQWYCVRSAHIDGDLGFRGMSAQIDYNRQKIGKAPDYAMMDARGGMHLANVDTRETWFDLFRREGLRYEPAPAEQNQTALLHDWLKPRWQPGGGQMTPRLRFLRNVTALDRGPLWGLKRFVWAPNDSKKRQYDQPGKDWIDCMAYLATAVETRNLTFQRYASDAVISEPRGGLARSYASNGRMLAGMTDSRRRLGQRRKLANTYGQKDWTTRIERGY